MDKILSEKLFRVKNTEPKQWIVDLSKGIRIDCDPNAKRASFPYYEFTPYLQFLSKTQLQQELGVKESTKKPIINEPCDVSSSKEGVCVVTRTIQLSNSHAGTHADQPRYIFKFHELMSSSHFVKDPPFLYFDDYQYNGPCTLINLSFIRKEKNPEITVDALLKVIDKTSLKKISRLLIRTYETYPNEWDPKFSYFSKECANFLATELENLLLIGIDTPSIDHPQASPIIEFCHGIFWKKRIAILENLDFSKFTSGSYSCNGYIYTRWNPYQDYKDGRGCMVTFLF
jgi:kynurenine formamidase